MVLQAFAGENNLDLQKVFTFFCINFLAGKFYLRVFALSYIFVQPDISICI
jgi:hypothetical protein